MENMQITIIKDALINDSNLLWSDSLFLPDILIWKLKTKAVIYSNYNIPRKELIP